MKIDYFGCDEMRDWLVSKNFKLALDRGISGNRCNWYAFRRSDYPTRECECNEGKPMQILIRPFFYKDENHAWESAEVDVTGEAKGLWFKLSAYSLEHDELRTRLQEIETRLLDAWNALAPDTKETA